MNVQTTEIQEQFHGGIDLAELERLGKTPEQILDLSSNILSVHHPYSVANAIFNTTVAAYPDRECTTLKKHISRRYSLDEQQILFGNGCCELIHLLARSVLKQGGRALVLEPTFSEYRRASELAGAEVEACFAEPGESSSHWATEISTQLEDQAYDLVWICNPNNPCGSSRDLRQIEELARNHPETIFAIDESYIEFAVSTHSIINSKLSNLVCLRSLTKSHALAGIRLGYVVAQERIIRLLKSHRIPWSVNAVAQTMGIAALEEQLHYDNAISRMHSNRKRLLEELKQRHLIPLESDANFFLLPVDNANIFRERLLRHDVLVRDCNSFGLDDYVRISVGDDAAINRLLAAIDDLPAILTADSQADQPLNHLRRWEPDFQRQLYDLFRFRRDVRKFRSLEIPNGCIERWIDAACMAPSVGLSQPWRFISVNDPKVRSEISLEYEKQNSIAADDYNDTEKAHYQSLKLAGIREAPEQLAVFVVSNPDQGRGLGRRTMPETVEYSVVAAIQNFWLAARAEGVGVGWVSILSRDRINEILQVPQNYQLIAYLCIGYPGDSDSDTPLLEKEEWQRRSEREQLWTTR